MSLPWELFRPPRIVVVEGESFGNSAEAVFPVLITKYDGPSEGKEATAALNTLRPAPSLVPKPIEETSAAVRSNASRTSPGVTAAAAVAVAVAVGGIVLVVRDLEGAGGAPPTAAPLAKSANANTETPDRIDRNPDRASFISYPPLDVT